MNKIFKSFDILIKSLIVVPIILITINAIKFNLKLVESFLVSTIVIFVCSALFMILSLIFKIKIKISNVYITFMFMFFSIISIGYFLNIEWSQYLSVIPFIPAYLIGFYLENEEEIKEKAKKNQEKLKTINNV